MTPPQLLHTRSSQPNGKGRPKSAMGAARARGQAEIAVWTKVLARGCFMCPVWGVDWTTAALAAWRDYMTRLEKHAGLQVTTSKGLLLEAVESRGHLQDDTSVLA